MNRSRFNKIAEAAYDRIAEAGGHFDISQVTAEIVAELSTEQASADLIAAFAQSLAERADDRRASRADSMQMDLLTGEVAALDAVWRVGGGRRVRVRDATREDVLLWFGIRSRNVELVNAAFEKDRHLVAELLVFMPDLHTTVPQAIEARKAAQR